MAVRVIVACQRLPKTNLYEPPPSACQPSERSQSTLPLPDARTVSAFCRCVEVIYVIKGPFGSWPEQGISSELWDSLEIRFPIFRVRMAGVFVFPRTVSRLDREGIVYLLQRD